MLLLLFGILSWALLIGVAWLLVQQRRRYLARARVIADLEFEACQQIRRLTLRAHAAIRQIALDAALKRE